MGKSKDVELITREFHAINHPSKPFRAGLKLRYTSRSGISPSIPFEKVRDEFAGDYRGKDNQGNEHSVRVSVEQATESEVSETDPCYNVGDYSKDFEYVPGGVDVTANGKNGGTICAPFYDSGDDGAHWITAAHLFSGTGIQEKARQPYDISTDSDTEYIGYCNQRDYGGNALNADDMAAIKDYNTSSYRDYVYGAGNCGDSHRIMGARSNQWLRNNQSSRAIYRQGSHSGRTAASFNYRPNTYRLTSPELVLNEEVEFGDSGGPYFDVTYDGEYNEYVAYICGVIARKVDGNEETESIGNTAQAVESTFGGTFF